MPPSENVKPRNKIMKVRMIAGGLLLLLAGFAVGRLEWPTPRWEYNFITFQRPTDMQPLYDLGDEAWEAVGFFKDWRTNQAVLLRRRMQAISHAPEIAMP